MLEIVALSQPLGDGLLTIELRARPRHDPSAQCSVRGCYREAMIEATTRTELVVPLCYAHEQLVRSWNGDPQPHGQRLGRGW